MRIIVFNIEFFIVFTPFLFVLIKTVALLSIPPRQNKKTPADAKIVHQQAPSPLMTEHDSHRQL